MTSRQQIINVNITLAVVFQEENLLLQFHVSNLEYACGCELSQVSALQWDQNEVYPQFMGQHSMIKDGYSALLHKLAEGLNIRLETEVSTAVYEYQVLSFKPIFGLYS